MNDFFTWSMLATYAGAVLATGMITQIFKGVGFIDKLPTRVFTYCVALVVLISANAVMGNFDWATAGLCLVNAVVVALAANGGYDALYSAIDTTGERGDNE